jgi:hypothetical protein
MAREIADVGLITVHAKVGVGIKRTELERPPSVGILALIVGLDPKRNGDNVSDPLIWTITELQGKPETEKHAGQISVPAETRTLWENRRSNVLGVLAEFTDDATLPTVAGHLYEVESTYRDGRMAVFVYDGPLNIPFQPTCSKEVSPWGWQRRSQLQQQGELRGVLRQALDLDQGEGFIMQALEDFYANRGIRPVIPPQLQSIEDFIARRETSPDVPIAYLPKPLDA